MSPLAQHHCRFQFRDGQGVTATGFADKRPEQPFWPHPPDHHPREPFQSIFHGVDELGWRKLTFDLSDTAYCTSAFLGRLISLWRRLQNKKGLFLLWNPAPPVAEVFRITKLDRILPSPAALGFASLDAAVNELYGPARPVTFDPDWRTETVRLLVEQMRASGDFSAMPILADALQDAGCESEAVLWHCRESGQLHVRGCWVLDLIAGPPAG